MFITILMQTMPWSGRPELVLTVEIGLGLMAAFVIAAVADKFLSVGRVKKSAGIYAPQVAKALKAGNWDEALALSKVYVKRTHLARVVYQGLKERVRLIERLPESLIARHMNEAMEREIIRVRNEYRRNVGGIDAIGRTAPFVGALGGSALTFALGIALAIPSIWVSTYILNWTSELEGDMKHAASELTTYIEQLIVESKEK